MQKNEQSRADRFLGLLRVPGAPGVSGGFQVLQVPGPSGSSSHGFESTAGGPGVPRAPGTSINHLMALSLQHPRSLCRHERTGWEEPQRGGWGGPPGPPQAPPQQQQQWEEREGDVPFREGGGGPPFSAREGREQRGGGGWGGAWAPHELQQGVQSPGLWAMCYHSTVQ